MKNTVSFSNGVATNDNYCKSSASDPAELQMYLELYGTINIAEAEQKIKNLVSSKGECGKWLEQGSIAWYCPVCATDSACIICQDCYDNSKHEGHHEYIKRGISGGKCDCGDPESWAISGSCSLHASGFTDETKVPPELLPLPLRSHAIKFLDRTVGELNGLCLRLEEILGLCGDQTVDIDGVDIAQQRILLISKVLTRLSKVSPIFLHMIALRFRQYSVNCKTRHRCGERREVDELYTHTGIDSDAGKSDLHLCGCTVIRNYMKVLFSFPYEARTFINTQLLGLLMRNRKLKSYMALGYFANYSCIIPYAIDGSTLATLGIQFVGYEDVVECVLSSEEYAQNIFGQMRQVFDQIRFRVLQHLVLPDTIAYQINLVCVDINCLIKEKHKKQFYPFILKFILALASFHSIPLRLEDINANPRREQLLRTIQEIEKIIEKYFYFMLSCVDFANVTQCGEIARTCLKALDIADSTPGYSSTLPHVIILHRCLSIFLVNYITTNYWLANLVSPTVHLGQARKFISEIATKLLGEGERFAHRWLMELLAAIGRFVLYQVDSNEAPANVSRTSLVKCPLDFSLAVLLLLLLSPAEVTLPWILKSMHPHVGAISLWADSLSADSNSLKEAAKAYNNDLQKLQALIEVSLHTICCWISNDIMYYYLMIYLRRKLLFPQEALERTKATANDYFQYSISRFIVLIYLLKDGGKEGGLTNSAIQREFPQGSLDVNRVEKCLEMLTSPYMDPKEHIVKFRLLDSGLKLFDPFILFSVPQRPCARPSQVQIPQQFDFFFGELIGTCDFPSRDSHGVSFVPYKELLRETLKVSGTLDSLLRLLKRDELSPRMTGCVIKMIMGCLEFGREEDKEFVQAKEIVSANIGKVIMTEKGNETILASYIRLLKGKTSEEIERTMKEETAESESKKSPDRTERIEEARKRIKEEFEGRIAAFKNKNKTILSQIKVTNSSDQSLVCAYCRDELVLKEYSKEQFGKITLIQKSTVYGHHLNQVLHELLGDSWKEEHKFKNVVGRSLGVVLDSCGHYLHSKCLSKIIQNPPNNSVTEIDSGTNPGMFLCPACMGCANTLVPPPEAVNEEDGIAVKYIQDYVLPKIKQCAYGREEQDKDAESNYMMICKCLAYQLNLVCPNNAEHFLIKEDLLQSLVLALKAQMQKNYYEEMTGMAENVKKAIRFLLKGRHRLFKTDLTLIYCMIVVAAKIMETPECRAAVYEELRDKITQIVKLGMLQIMVRLVYEEIGETANYETLLKVLKNPESFDKLKCLSKLESRLVPFLKKLLCLKILLWPSPNSDASTDMLKVSWLDDKHLLSFCPKVLDLTEDIKSPFIFDSPRTHKPQYLSVPAINMIWIRKALVSLLRHVKKEWEEGESPVMPKGLVIHDASRIVPRLVRLPKSFDDLQRVYAKKVCWGCGRSVADSAACLVCGELLCVGNVCGLAKKGIGVLTAHSLTCPGGCGIFLRLINNKVLLMDGGQVCTYPSPYVNKYGESVDVQKNPRCGPLSLDEQIFDELNTMYLTHQVKQSVRSMSLRSFLKLKPYVL